MNIIKKFSKHQIIYSIVVFCLASITGIFLFSYIRPAPRDILTGRWKRVSAYEDRSLAFFPDGNVFLYVDGQRTYKGKFRFVDRKTLKIDYFFITSSYFSIKVLSRTAIDMTDEKGSTVRYTKVPE